jgi:phospholipid/cholesterol/gamma-HCH transport system substrate-binding protein
MKAQGSDILVGLFVLALGGALVAGILWLSSGRLGQVYDEYVVYMEESVSGLRPDSTVNYYGVSVGRVRDIQLGTSHPRRVRLLLQLDAGTPVKQDTVATLETQGLTGLAYINLRGGSADAPLLTAPEGEQWPVIASEPSIWGRLDQSLAELADNMIEGSAKLNRLLSDENQTLITQSLRALMSLTAELAGRTTDLTQAIQDLGETLHHSKLASARLPELAQRFSDTAEALQAMTEEISRSASSVRQTVASGGQDFRDMTARTGARLQYTLDEMRLAAEQFRHLGEQLERDPQVLLRGQAPPPPGPGE